MSERLNEKPEAAPGVERGKLLIRELSGCPLAGVWASVESKRGKLGERWLQISRKPESGEEAEAFATQLRAHFEGNGRTAPMLVAGSYLDAAAQESA